MRLLIYGMQSSGASLFAFLLSQEPETLAVVDCWGGIAPAFDGYLGDIVLDRDDYQAWRREPHGAREPS
jgi:hypothetical protein